MTSYRLYAIADGMADKSNPNAVGFGTANFLCDSLIQTARTFVRFALSGLPQGKVISKAILSLYFDRNTTTGYIHMKNIPVVNRTWIDGRVTWNNQPTIETYPDIALTTNGAFGWHNWDITSYINDQHMAGVNVDFALFTAEDGAGICALVGSHRGSLGPRLYIETIDIPLSVDRTSANTGESIKLTGSWFPNSQLNIYYMVDRLIGPHEHVVRTQTDTNGNFEAIAILPSDAHNALDQPITGPSILEFQVCFPGFWPYECSGTIISSKVPITISPGTPIGTAPGIYTKNYPGASTYSGPAIVEPVTAKTLKFFDFGETRAISQEEALFNILMGVETAALQTGLTLLTAKATYSEDLLNYIFDIEFTYVKPPNGAGLAVGGIQSLVVPVILWYAAIGVIAIIGLYIVYQIVGIVKEIIFSPAGALLAGGLGIVLIAGAAIFILPKILPSAKKTITQAKEYAKGELAKRGVTV